MVLTIWYRVVRAGLGDRFHLSRDQRRQGGGPKDDLGENPVGGGYCP